MIDGGVSFDTHEFRKDLRTLAGAVELAAQDAVSNAANAAFQEAKQTRMFNDKTGRLRQSVGLRVDAAGGNAKAQVSAGKGLAYAVPIHDGSRPHIIAARRAPMLRFKIGARWISTLYVRHPGTSPRPFVTEAGDNAARLLEDTAHRRVTDAVDRFNGR